MIGPTIRELTTSYESLLWGTMDSLGINESVERKVVVAVAIQFLVSLAQLLLPFLVSGVLWYALAGALFAGAAIAFVNTLLIVRRDFIEPITSLDRTATKIAAGDVTVDVERSSQPDEIGSLTNAFVDMGQSLTTVSEQAAALARQEFDAPVLEEPVPGEFGRSLDRMAASMAEHTEELEVMTEELEARSDRLESLVEQFGQAAQQARDGDLTATIDEAAVEDVDEELFADVVEHYNDLVYTLAGTVSDVQSFADRVATASDDVSTSMTEVDHASDEMARSVQEISDGAASQTDELQQVADKMNTLSATVEEIAASADDVAETASEAAERGRSGREAATAAIDELDELDSRISDTAGAVEQLVSRIDEIDGIVSFINDIAEETNILALNASIEAARADATGDGFAVVADEIKRLAEETSESAGEISNRIGAIQADAQGTVDDVQTMETQVSESIRTIESTLEDFDDVVGVVDDVDTTIQEISRATEEQAGTTQDVVRMVDDVASVSEETAGEAENVAAASEEQTTTLSNVTDDVRAVASEADDLQSQLSQFVVETGAGESTEQVRVAQPQD